MKVVVFGGAGFLGSHVCDKLSEAGYAVTIFDRSGSRWLRQDQQMIVGDILDETAVERAIEGARFVFNFAGIADIDEASGRPVDTVRYNILGNAVVLEAARKAGVERFVFASSVYVYSKSGGFYRCSKQACELYIENYKDTYDLNYTILRYGSLYGTRADRRNAIYNFIRQALTERRLTYSGSPNALREYIHVEDAARASVEILQPGYANDYIVLTGPQSLRVGDLFKMIAEIVGGEVRMEFNSSNSSTHYETTPYSFQPKVGKKLTLNMHVDMGQGVLHVMEELHREMHPELHDLHGFLVQD